MLLNITWNNIKESILNAPFESTFTSISMHVVLFRTWFIVATLFVTVKAFLPMIYQFLTLQMVESTDENGIINQTNYLQNKKK